LISYWPVSNVHSAPTPSFFLISFGSIVHSNFEMFSTIDPAAPSDEASARKTRRLLWMSCTIILPRSPSRTASSGRRWTNGSPSRMARKAAASHSPPKTNSGAAAAGRSMRALSRLADVAGFWTLDRTTITGRSAVILRQHTTPFRPMIVPFDDLELVYQSLRNSSRHIRVNFRASMRRTPDWAPFNLGT